MDRWIGKVAIVTGASSGIGYAIAKSLVEKGMKVAGLARRVENIEELARSLNKAPGELKALKCDLSKEEEILPTFNWISSNMGPVHVLINSAGFTRPTNLTEGSTEEWKRVFDVNVMALCICTREAVKIMRKHNVAGHIIHLNAIAGHQVPNMPEPNFNVYPASKFAVTALTESLRQELRYFKTKIKITSVSPGCVRTEFQDGFPADGTKEALLKMPGLNPKDVAEAITYVLSTGPEVQVHELTIKPLGEMF